MNVKLLIYTYAPDMYMRVIASRFNCDQSFNWTAAETGKWFSCIADCMETFDDMIGILWNITWFEIDISSR